MRNVLGFEDADHEETNPGAEPLAVSALACSLVGQSGSISISPGSRAAGLYGATETTESFYCNFGVDPECARLLEPGGLAVTGMSSDGEVRIVELVEHPFFLATLFIPQMRSTPAEPHPLIAGFVAAAREHARAPA